MGIKTKKEENTMRPFKFFNSNPNRFDELVSWDFRENYHEEIGGHRVEVEWHSSFVEFLSRFDPAYYDTILIDEIRIPFDENNTYQDINSYNYESWIDEFVAHNGRVRVTWLNFDII